MRRTLIALGCLMLAGPALAQSVGEKTGVNSALGIAPSTEDFVKQVAISDMFELQSNQLGEQKGNAQEKTFAAQMVKDHTKTSSELKSMVESGKVKATLPTALDSAHQSKLDKLKAANGVQRRLLRHAGQRPQGRGVAVRALCQGRRKSRLEGLGWQDSPGPATPSRHGAESRQVQVNDAAPV